MATNTISGTTPLAHTFNGQTLRHVILDGEPWFHATDACRCLGLSTRGGTTQHLLTLNADERLKRTKATLGDIQGGLEFVGAAGMVNAVSESGLYKMIMRAHPSRPAVAAFQDWVTREVLPSIRKTGGYLLNEHARVTAHADDKQAMPKTRKNPSLGNKPSPLDRGNPTPRSGVRESIHRSR